MTTLDDGILAKLKEKERVDIGRPGRARAWEFNKITLDKNGLWVLIVDFEGNFDQIEMSYDVSVILSPENYDQALRNNLGKFTNPQRELFENEERFIRDMEKIHYDYAQESKLFGIYDFKASIMKFERKPKNRQIKFIVDSSVAVWFSNNFHNVHRSAIVLNKSEAE